MTKTFTALTQDGTVNYSGRGKTGAAQKAIDALCDYRASVKSASGMLYGNPLGMGQIMVDGVKADHFDGYYIADDLAR